jgi:hypothetical protein
MVAVAALVDDPPRVTNVPKSNDDCVGTESTFSFVSMETNARRGKAN